EVIDGSAIDWDPEVTKELGQTLNLIGSIEGKAAAMRAVGWRLLQKNQGGLAVVLAGRLANHDPTPPLLAQHVAFLLAKNAGKKPEKLLPDPKEKGDNIDQI